jgi:hypothetical protein
MASLASCRWRLDAVLGIPALCPNPGGKEAIVVAYLDAFPQPKLAHLEVANRDVKPASPMRKRACDGLQRHRAVVSPRPPKNQAR